MRTFTTRVASLVAVAVVALTGVARADDLPKRDKKIEAVLKKFNNCDYEFQADDGCYLIVWKENGIARHALWALSGSEGAKGLPAGASRLTFIHPVADGVDANAVVKELDKTHDVKSYAVDKGKGASIGMPFVVKEMLSADELTRAAEKVFGIAENATNAVGVKAPAPGGDNKATVQKKLASLRNEEKRLTNSIAQCEKNEAYWQKKFDESCLPGRTLNPSAGVYASYWLRQKLSDQQKLSQVQDEISEMEGK